MTTFLIGGTGPMPLPIISIPPHRYYKVTKKVDPAIAVLLLPLGGLWHMDWTMRKLEDKIKRLANPDEPIELVGHSQGGVIAGWIGARNPDLVSNVVSVYGPWRGSKVTPVEGKFSHAPICEWLCPDSPRLTPIREEVADRLGQRLTSIFSTRDGIVIPFHSGYVPGIRNVLIGTGEDFRKHQDRFPEVIHHENAWSPKHLDIGFSGLIQAICTGLGRNSEDSSQVPPVPSQRRPRQRTAV